MRARRGTFGVARQGPPGEPFFLIVSNERIGSLNEALSHHRVVRGKRLNAQTPRFGPLRCVFQAPKRAQTALEWARGGPNEVRYTRKSHVRVSSSQALGQGCWLGPWVSSNTPETPR